MKTKNPMTIVNTQLARNLPTYISALSTGHRSSPCRQSFSFSPAKERLRPSIPAKMKADQNTPGRTRSIHLDGHLITHLQALLEIVGGEHESTFPRMQGIQDLSQHPGSVLIQPCIGLIQEQDVRIMEKSSSDRQPLLHASGICRDQVLLAILQTHLNQQVTNPGVQVLQSIHAPIEPEILHRAEVGVEKGVVRNDANTASQSGGVRIHIHTAYPHAPF